MSMARTTLSVRPDGTIGHIWQQVRPAGHALKILEQLSKQ
jgi:peroxiredoxin